MLQDFESFANLADCMVEKQCDLCNIAIPFFGRHGRYVVGFAHFKRF